MPIYRKLGEVPRKRHIKFPRESDKSFNPDLTVWRCRPVEQQKTLSRNSGADEIIFTHGGKGNIETIFGRVPYRELDYIVIPRGTTYRIVSDDINREDHLILECQSPVR